MKELFLGLCSASIIPSIAVLAAVLLRPLLKKGPSFLRCVIWAVVFARLVIPVGLIELSVPVSPFPSTAEESVSLSAPDAVQNDVSETVPNVVPDVIPDNVPTPDNDVPNVIPDTVPTPDNGVPNVVPDTVIPDPAPTLDTDVAQPVPGAASTAEPKVDVVEILSLVWVCGIIVMLGYLIASVLLLHYQVRDAVVFDSRVRVLGRNCSPFVSGFFRPLIYIPASANRADWPYYIAHEESHIKRFDHVLKPLAFLVLCAYWFNPLVWVAYLLLSKDIEYACDEKTVKNMEETDRKAYSLALLSVSQGESIAFSPPLSFGKVSVKERIIRVMKGKIPVWAVCLTVVLCAAILTLMVCTATGRSDDISDDTSSEVSDETSGETSEETSEETPSWMEMPFDTVRYAPNASLPPYTVAVVYADESKKIAKQLVLSEAESGRELQKIDLPDNDHFTEEPILMADVTFDGYIDLLLPNQQPASAVWYHAFVWDTETGELVYAPGFSELSNAALDEENTRILSHRVADGYETYGISVYDTEKKDFVSLGSLCWDSHEGNPATFREYDGNGNVVEENRYASISPNPADLYFESYFASYSIWNLGSKKWEMPLFPSDSFRPSWETAYTQARVLHEQSPETYRDPGELQSETLEMVQLEDGQWYQSYVAPDVNIRYVFLSNAEYEMNANWDFIPIGSEKTYYLYNAGARFEDETGVARYVERPIAVWGELDGGDSEKYSRVLVLTDELTVCVEGEGGTCAFYQADRIALPRWLGPLFWDKDEFDVEAVTGVVMLDEDGIFYLKDVALFLPTPLKAAYVNALSLHAQAPETYRDPGEIQYETQEMVRLENGQWYQSYVASDTNVRYAFMSNTEYEMDEKWAFVPVGSAVSASPKDQAVSMSDFVREPESLRLQQTVYRFISACIRSDRAGALAFARNVDALPAQFPSSSPDRLTA